MPLHRGTMERPISQFLIRAIHFGALCDQITDCSGIAVASFRKELTGEVVHGYLFANVECQDSATGDTARQLKIENDRAESKANEAEDCLYLPHLPWCPQYPHLILIAGAGRRDVQSVRRHPRNKPSHLKNSDSPN